MKKIKEIEIYITEDSQIYNQFNCNQLSDELNQYIYNQFKGTSLKTNIVLSVYHNFKLTDEEKIKLVDKIRENYGLDVQENLIKLRFEVLKCLVLLFFGLLLSLFSHLIISNNFYLISEFFYIFGWILIYEFLYGLVFVIAKIIYKNKRFTKLIKAKINFVEIKA